MKYAPKFRAIGFAVIFASLLFAVFQNQAQLGGGEIASKSRMVSEVKAVAPGETFRVALVLDHPEKWHSYYINPGGIGSALSFEWEMPEGFEAGKVQWPVPHISEMIGIKSRIKTYGYEGSGNVFPVEISVPDSAQPGTEVTIRAKATWQICDEKNCLPEGGDFSVTIQIAESTEPDPTGKPIIEGGLKKLPVSLDDATALEKDDVITLTATLPESFSNPKSAYFFDANGQVDAQKSQEVEIDGNRVTLKLPRNEGTKSEYLDPGPKLDVLSGILAVKTADNEFGFGIRQNLDGSGPAAGTDTQTDNVPPPVSHSESSQATPEEIAAGLELYDSEAKPEYVLLKGVKDLTILPAMGLFFIGGLLLNLMPCVFPVLGIKVMGFVAQAGEEEKKVKNHGLVFGLGVLVSMWVLATIIIAAGQSWGGQLQSPAFLAGLVILLFLMGLNLAGVFEFGTALTGVGGDLQRKKGYSGSFFSGVLTTLIATPCSGPFLGSVMAFAFDQPPATAFLLFSVFAAGIASPYVVLAFFPKAINKLPKPGPWMESFKKGMSFAMFGTAVFFLGSFAKQTGYDGLTWLLFALVVIGLAAWIYGTWSSPVRDKSVRYAIGYGLAILVAAVGIQMTRVATDKVAEGGGSVEEGWKAWYPGVLEMTRQKKRIAWIDYTADW
ncbi:MAG: hypothetical protein HKN23_10280 [Verrucomicrobiales bacterium]|nr:hypothetical protein [Verrucomicrobiales bacterium]